MGTRKKNRSRKVQGRPLPGVSEAPGKKVNKNAPKSFATNLTYERVKVKAKKKKNGKYKETKEPD